uniref:TATA-box binding protein associated factor 4b n=1 Tax=Varanus komodoensis TaxID=61221 RepID=A0A8D2KUT0_VARKO
IAKNSKRALPVNTKVSPLQELVGQDLMFSFPAGAVLVRSNTGQLMLLSQQALGQAQNNATVRWSIPTNSSTVKIQTVQNSGTQVVKVLAAPVKTVSGTTHSVTSTVKKPVIIQVLMLEIGALICLFLISCQDMLENVKKCKNFLATLIKLACSGPQAPEMGQNVKNLVQSLLDAKIEPEEFTKKLYIELKSSPQPNLVPFLKKSVFALRQLMPNTETFIQQCLQQSVPQTAVSTTAMSTTSIVANSSPVTTTSLLSARPVSRTPVGILSPQTGTVSCTSLTRKSGSLPLIQPVHAASIQGASANTSTQLTLGISTVKAVCPTSSSPMVTTGTTALQGVKPVHIPAASSATLVACSSVKSVSSSAMTTSLPVVKPASTTASATLAKAVKASVQTGMPVTGAPITIRVAHPNSLLSQPVRTSQAIKVKQLIVQQPPGSILKKVTTLQPASALPIVNKLDGKMPLNAFIQASQLPSGSIVKQITLPGNKILSLQASPVQRNKIRENGTTSFRDEDDINDVTSMAGVNLSEESACILATNSGTAGSIIRSCPEELLLALDVLKKKILEIGKRHDITEVNSDVLNLVSHAMQERLRGLLEKLTIIAQHRLMIYKGNDNYTICSDTQAHLKFFEQLDHVEKQRKNEEEREMLLRAAKSRSNKEDPEQLRLKQKAKEMQQLELAQIQQMEANRAALAAIGPRKKRPLDSPNLDLNRSPSLAKPYLRPRIIRICLRDLIFCMEQEREMKHSLALYQALLK